MPSTPYMKLYIGDYLGDTQHLSCLEHGAYILLIMAYWQNGGPLKNDPKLLRRLTRTNPKEFQKVSENVLKMFQVTDGMLVHKRVQKELTKREQVSTAARDAINTRWYGRNTDVLPTNYERNTTPIVHSPESREDIIESISKKDSLSYIPDEIKIKNDPEPDFPVAQGYRPNAGTISTRIEAARSTWNSLAPGIGPICRLMAITFKPEDSTDCMRVFQVYTDDEVSEAMRNYSEILQSEDHEVKSRYQSFVGFIRGGVEKFVSASDPWTAYKRALSFADQEEANTKRILAEVFAKAEEDGN